ncbi:MAG: SAM-dependent chlorinase/fluorinase [Gammaproteobacteria bacterium]|nr:SAM-dependent chlorinase/fluorinase [Gammaproteobacteria bacterium]
MIVLCTDFGLHGPYVGQVRARLLRDAPGVPVINLFSDLPSFNARASAYLLAAYTDEFTTGTVFLCVVDPGVGSARRPLVVQADGRWFVGPDNGLLEVIGSRARQVRQWEITYAPERMSASFHGRDLFAPVAARLAMGLPVPGELLTDKAAPGEWPDDLYEIVYIDHFGNAMTGIRACVLDKSARLSVKGQELAYARTFSVARAGEPFWYDNANGLVEIALKEASGTHAMDLKIGATVTLAQGD